MSDLPQSTPLLSIFYPNIKTSNYFRNTDFVLAFLLVCSSYYTSIIIFESTYHVRIITTPQPQPKNSKKNFTFSINVDKNYAYVCCI